MTEQAQEQQFEINKIYIKDVSAESPNSPEIFQADWEPEINLNLGNNVIELEENAVYEVTLTLNVTAKLGDKVAYIIEVDQAGIFTLVGFEEEQKAYLMGAVIPNLLFPYARESISSLSEKIGFPSMLLNPIDFTVLYQQHLEEQLASNDETEENADTTH